MLVIDLGCFLFFAGGGFWHEILVVSAEVIMQVLYVLVPLLMLNNSADLKFYAVSNKGFY